MKGIGIQVTDSNDNGTFLDMKVDVQRDTDGKIVSGMAIGDTLQQNITFMLMAERGEFKAVPELGVGLKGILLDNDFLSYEHKIRQQLPVDGLRIKKINLFENQPVIIEADYEQ
ncbi:MAG: hypothetical protein KKC03_06110 [Bacteroidetes bacterium]|nr:hypothetical protein [Bacteroidota bacterium]